MRRSIYGTKSVTRLRGWRATQHSRPDRPRDRALSLYRAFVGFSGAVARRIGVAFTAPQKLGDARRAFFGLRKKTV